MHDMKPDLRDLKSIVSFKAPSDVIEKADAMAATEGLTRASFVRRALLLDLKRRGLLQTEAAA